MARRKPKAGPSHLMFDVVYEDGTQSSNRKISSALLDGSFGDDPKDLAMAAIVEQDNLIAEKSGISRGKIKSLVRQRR